jgi:CBS domain-containing protein
MKISRILATKGKTVYTIGPEQTLRDVAIILAQHNIGVLVVMDSAGQLVGIISERDIIRQAAKREDVLSILVSEAMTRHVITGVPQDDIMSVIHTMTERHFRHLPIMDQGKLVGMISVGDIMKAQRDQYRGEVDTLETQLLAGEE